MDGLFTKSERSRHSLRTRRPGCHLVLPPANRTGRFVPAVTLPPLALQAHEHIVERTGRVPKTLRKAEACRLPQESGLMISGTSGRPRRRRRSRTPRTGRAELKDCPKGTVDGGRPPTTLPTSRRAQAPAPRRRASREWRRQTRRLARRDPGCHTSSDNTEAGHGGREISGCGQPSRVVRAGAAHLHADVIPATHSLATFLRRHERPLLHGGDDCAVEGGTRLGPAQQVDHERLAGLRHEDSHDYNLVELTVTELAGIGVRRALRRAASR